MAYAQNTKVSPERSRNEIERLLLKYGAGQFGYMTDAEKNLAHIIFTFDGLRVRVTVPLPNPDEFRLTKRGRPKKDNIAYADWQKECNRRWRSLTLLVKAKLVAVRDGVATFEEEFLPYLLWGSGQTTAEQLHGRIRELADINITKALPLPME